mgnify:CR=1 FL=1
MSFEWKLFLTPDDFLTVYVFLFFFVWPLDGQWQSRIASSDVILQANQSVDFWLVQAEQLVSSVPSPLQFVTYELFNAVKHKTITKSQGRIA